MTHGNSETHRKREEHLWHWQSSPELRSTFFRQKKNKSKFGERNGVAKEPMANMTLKEMLHSFPLSSLHFLHYRVCSLRESTGTRRRRDAAGKEHVLYMLAIQSQTGKRRYQCLNMALACLNFLRASVYKSRSLCSDVISCVFITERCWAAAKKPLLTQGDKDLFPFVSF